jgi:hypothetical protein
VWSSGRQLRMSFILTAWLGSILWFWVANGNCTLAGGSVANGPIQGHSIHVFLFCWHFINDPPHPELLPRPPLGCPKNICVWHQSPKPEWLHFTSFHLFYYSTLSFISYFSVLELVTFMLIFLLYSNLLEYTLASFILPKSFLFFCFILFHSVRLHWLSHLLPCFIWIYLHFILWLILFLLPLIPPHQDHFTRLHTHVASPLMIHILALHSVDNPARLFNHLFIS